LASHRWGAIDDQVLAVERRGPRGEAASLPSLASQQLALTIEAPPAQADLPVKGARRAAP
jgi:hypothetical protein